MYNNRDLRYLVTLVLASAAAAMGTSTAGAGDANAPPQIPTCDKKIGTLAVTEPENPWWTAMQLDSPAALIKVYVSQSKCFTLVDRGKGLAAAKAERELASSGEERVGSNIGKGQMKAADYVLVPDIANRNGNAQGTNIGGALGGLIGHGLGAVVGGISLKSKTADVVLTMTDVRSTEQVALEQGHAKKTDLGWLGGGGLGFFGGFAAAGASSYANTEIGQVVAMAYLEAYTKLVNDVKNVTPDAKADNVQQAVTMAKPSKLYTNPDLKSKVVRDLDAGMMLYPTGDKQGVWWKVNDELGNEGWIVSTMVQLAK
ncbi:MAG TPA: CsgG/HfaB family protein [Steroidobacteraceae bacterium]|jgi:curli biogenesis system outer membrane secretion channel CsgG